MAEKTLKYLACIFLVVLLSLSCAKLPEAPTGKEPGLGMEVLPLGDTIPLNWGNLIAVNNSITVASRNGVYSKEVQLWFLDKEGNIHMVLYDVETNRFNRAFKYLKRR
jgi:hypothetical protein